MAFFQVKDLHVHFSTDRGTVRAVNGMRFTLERGETLGIVGESGSGKSVTAMAIMGLLPIPPAIIYSGKILLEGQDLLSQSPSARRSIRGNRIAMIFQDPMTSLNPFLRVSRQLTEVLEVHKGMSRKNALHRVIEMLERVGIPDAARRVHSYPHEFSGGMRQRVVIAMALLCEPELLIADEPTTALDVTIQAQILDLLRELKHDRGMATILITHDLGVVAGAADSVTVMYGGQRMEHSTTHNLFTHAKHPYTQGLLKAIPRLGRTSEKERLYSIPGLPPVLTEDAAGCPFASRCEHAEPICRDTFPVNSSRIAGHEVYCHLYAQSGAE